MSDLKDRLKNRNRPLLNYKLMDASTDEIEAQEVKVKQLNDDIYKAERTKSRLPKDQANNRKLASLKKDLPKEEKALEDMYITLKFQALPPEEYEVLLDEYGHDHEKGSKEAIEADKVFITHLVAQCSLEPKYTHDEVKDDLWPSLNKGEQMDLYTKVYEINLRVPATQVPKDYMKMLASLQK